MRKLTDEEFQASMEKASQAVDQGARLKFRFLMEQREEILTAFIAKYGFEPDECVQVEFKTPDGGFGWRVRKCDKNDP